MNQKAAGGIAIVGGGIAGLGLALHLHSRGIACEVYEAVAQVKELGVGITLLPHAMRELAALGLQSEIEAAGIENLESVFYNRHGQFIYSELRGRHAGYTLPEVGIHRGRLHRILWEAAHQRLGAERIHSGHRLVGLSQDSRSVSLQFAAPDGSLRQVQASVAVACDGINSAVRRHFYPNETLAFTGINTWRGTTRRAPILTGRSYMRIGSIETGKMVIYPIIQHDDGTQTINWMAEIRRAGAVANDWNQGGQASDVLPIYDNWRFDWLDVPALIRDAQQILEYPMVDRDPLAQWTMGRITLMGDAAHPMYPRGSNGSAQALIDARSLAHELWTRRDAADPVAAQGEALLAYESLRRPVANQIVLTNRSTPPDLINIRVEELTGGKPFRHIDDVISQTELREISESYKRIAGFAKESIVSSSQAA
jgi:5-methylphenazine-1-carboxylate 1-monooxygenase